MYASVATAAAPASGARAAAAAGAADLPRGYRRLLAAWTALGVPALLAFLAIFYLMVARPM